MIDIRVLIREEREGINIEISSGTLVHVIEYYSKRKDMNLWSHINVHTKVAFSHALEVCLDQMEFKEPGAPGEGGE